MGEEFEEIDEKIEEVEFEEIEEQIEKKELILQRQRQPEQVQLSSSSSSSSCKEFNKKDNGIDTVATKTIATTDNSTSNIRNDTKIPKKKKIEKCNSSNSSSLLSCIKLDENNMKSSSSSSSLVNKCEDIEVANDKTTRTNFIA